jgi:hypothetical protein
MNNYILSNKRVLVIATMLSIMMLAASSMPSLISTKAFAAQSVATDIVDGVFDQTLDQDENSGDEQGTSEGAASSTPEENSGDEQGTSEGAASSTPENDPNSDINLDAESEQDTSRVEEDDSVQVDPIIENNVQNDMNLEVETELVMDQEDCEEAQNEAVQGNGQRSEQQAGGEGRVGDGNVYVSPKTQYSGQFALNGHFDVDVVLVEGCNPVDDIKQINAQEQGQQIDSDLSSSPTGTVIIPANQIANNYEQNIGVNKDIVMPVL